MPAPSAAPRRFWTATEREVRAGKTTDVYFLRTLDALRAAGRGRVRAVAEVTAGELPAAWPWAAFTGVDEALALLEGRALDAWALPEGTLFPARDALGVRLPVLVVEGAYADYGALESPLLGLLCQASGIATQAARFRALAGPAQLLSFGVRRMHPALAPLIDRSAFVGGCDAVSCVLSAELLGEEPQGTMPHALMLMMGGLEDAWRAHDEAVDRRVRRVVLVDTLLDERAEVLRALEVLGPRLWGVRLDTPASRRGSLPDIVREVRWELARRGRPDVKVFASGSLGERDIGPLREAGADGFGIGTHISNAPTVNFALDLVEVAGQAVGKRGKFSGRKMAWRCPACMAWRATPFEDGAAGCPRCGAAMRRMLARVLREGKPRATEAPRRVRRRVLAELARAGPVQPS